MLSLSRFVCAVLVLAPAVRAQAPLDTAAAVGSPERQPRVWTVDAAGGGDFLDLQPAIDAALPGDAIRVLPATLPYGTADIDKSITIAGTGPERVAVSEILVANTRDVVLRQLSIEPSSTLAPVSLSVAFSSSVWIEDCEVRPAIGHSSSILVAFSDSVVLVRSAVLGGTTPPGLNVDPGLGIQSSNVHVFDCLFVGNGTALATGCPAAQGGAGANAGFSSFLFAANTTFRGGRGAASNGVLCPSGNGGDGIFLLGSELQALNCSFVGGYGGRGPTPGLPGRDVQTISGPSPVLASGPVRHYAVRPGVARRGKPLRLTAEGPAGDLLVSLVSVDSIARFDPASAGSLVLAGPLVVRVAGTVPPSETFTTTLPAVPPAFPSARVLFQGVFFGAAGDVTLSEPSAVLLTY